MCSRHRTTILSLWTWIVKSEEGVATTRIPASYNPEAHSFHLASRAWGVGGNWLQGNWCRLWTGCLTDDLLISPTVTVRVVIEGTCFG